MALDGLVVSNIVHELNTLLSNGRINKIAQPENDELLFTIKSGTGQLRLLISANPSLPLIYITQDNKPSPLTAPNFCMLLRKHLNSAKILSVTQPSLERVIDLEIEHYNDLGDLCVKHIFVEIMGKHSNIIFTDDKLVIIDSIKHVSALVSSVREVLPGRKYFIPDNNNKSNPFELDEDTFKSIVTSRENIILQKVIYQGITGISPLIAAQLLIKSCLPADSYSSQLNDFQLSTLWKTFEKIISDIKASSFHPNIIYQNSKPVEFSSIELSGYNTSDYQTVCYESISRLLCDYYARRNEYTRIHQKSADLRKICHTAIERTAKKLDLQSKQLKDTENREKYKVYGDLLMAFSYDVVSGSKSYTCRNFYDEDKEVTIPLDPDLSPTDNGKRYYEKFAKQKRTYTALSAQLVQTKEELAHLESISNELDIAESNLDLDIIKRELAEFGYIRERSLKKQAPKRKSAKPILNRPLHYVTRDGYNIYVGKNNYQNDELTFKIASGNDWWFHSKTIAGSHVILKTDGCEPSDLAFELAANAAAYFSKGRNNDKVEIDYIQRKNVKKPAGAKPGFVIYHTNYSMVAKPDISQLTLAEE